jgi:hypothetical protein
MHSIALVAEAHCDGLAASASARIAAEAVTFNAAASARRAQQASHPQTSVQSEDHCRSRS